MIEAKDYPAVAQGLLAFMHQTGHAADEIAGAMSTGAALSPAAQRIIEVWRGAHAAPRPYLHPTAQAIEADAETEMFAVITAQRAMADALAKSALSPELKLRALIRLARDVAPGGHVQVQLAADNGLDYLPVPYEVGMRRIAKALVMASYAGTIGEPPPREMLDFIEHAQWLVDGGILPPAAVDQAEQVPA